MLFSTLFRFSGCIINDRIVSKRMSKPKDPGRRLITYQQTSAIPPNSQGSNWFLFKCVGTSKTRIEFKKDAVESKFMLR